MTGIIWFFNLFGVNKYLVVGGTFKTLYLYVVFINLTRFSVSYMSGRERQNRKLVEG